MAMQLDPKRYDVAIKQLQKDLSEKEVIIKTQTRVIEETKEEVANFKIVTADEIQAVVAEFEIVKADLASFNTVLAEYIEANNIKVGTIEGDLADFKTVVADDIEAINGTFENLDAKYAKIETLEADYAKIETLESDYAKITDLDAINADITNLNADVADIDTLIFGSASGSTIQTSFANAVIAQLGDAQITSAMIKEIAASKITSGNITTNNVNVVSEDGKLLISDETIQISDDTRVRVQIGKDASDDYSINVWDADGNLMFSEGGITDSAIKEAIIRNDMVSDDANISGGKLDIASVFTEMNKDGTETLKATKVHLDDKNQTLEVAFKEMSDDVSSQGTAISVVQGQINSKIWSQDIDTATEGLATEDSVTTLTTQYSELDQKVDGITLTVASHTTELAGKADSSDVAAVHDKVTQVEADLDGFRTNVSDTYATKDALSTANTSIEQNAEDIKLAATKTEVATTLKGYSTTEQMNAAISASANEITSTVSESYITKDAAENIYETKSNVSILSQTVGQIEGKIKDAEGNISTVTQTVDGLTVTTNDGSTRIDGGKILTGSVKAEQVDVDSLFAEDIEATGSVTGLTFISEGELTEENLGESMPDVMIVLKSSRLNASGALITMLAGLSENSDHVKAEHSAFGSQYKVENEKTVTGGDLGLDTGYAEHVLDANSYGLNFRVRRSGESDFLSLFKVDVNGAYWEDSKLISQADLNKGVNGKISRADKAEKDGNGKVIADTYLPLTGGTINGDLDINGDLSVGGVDIKEIVSAGSSVGTLISTDDGAGNVTLSII